MEEIEMREITIADLLKLEEGTFVIMYENDKPINTGIITEIREWRGIIVFKSASKSSEAPIELMWNKNCNAWSPTVIKPMTGETVFCVKGAFYTLIEDLLRRRLPQKIN